MTESAYSRLSVYEARMLDITLMGLWTGAFGGLENVDLTMDLVREVYSEYILGEFNTHTVDMSVYSQNFSNENISTILFDAPQGFGRIDLNQYIQNAIYHSSTPDFAIANIDFVGSSTDLFGDGVLGTSSVRVTGSARIENGQIVADLK